MPTYSNRLGGEIPAPQTDPGLATLPLRSRSERGNGGDNRAQSSHSSMDLVGICFRCFLLKPRCQGSTYAGVVCCRPPCPYYFPNFRRIVVLTISCSGCQGPPSRSPQCLKFQRGPFGAEDQIMYSIRYQKVELLDIYLPV